MGLLAIPFYRVSIYDIYGIQRAPFVHLVIQNLFKKNFHLKILYIHPIPLRMKKPFNLLSKNVF